MAEDEISIERFKIMERKLYKFESQEKKFHDSIRSTYLEIAEKEKKRFRVVDSSQSIEIIQQKINLILDNFLL